VIHKAADLWGDEVGKEVISTEVWNGLASVYEASDESHTVEEGWELQAWVWVPIDGSHKGTEVAVGAREASGTLGDLPAIVASTLDDVNLFP